MKYKECPPQFLHYQQEISTPTEEEYRNGYIPLFDFEENVINKFKDVNKPRELARIVRELIINCHEHGNKFNPNKKVFIIVDEDDKSLTVTVKDEGVGYTKKIINELKIPTWQKPKEKVAGGHGSGFYGIRKKLEDKELDNVEITGNEIKLTIKK